MCLEMLGHVLKIRTVDSGTPSVDGLSVADRTAIVDVDGVARRVSLAVLDLEGTSVAPGDWILSHTGLAIRVVNETDARKLQNERNEMHAGLSAIRPPEREQYRDDGEA